MPPPQSGLGWLSFQLVLYVHLHGSSSNSLNVYVQTAEALQLVWSRTGDLGGYWFRERVDFQVAQAFKVGEAWESFQVPSPPGCSRAGRRQAKRLPAAPPAAPSLSFRPHRSGCFFSQILIEGRTGTGQEGSVALDDLRLSPHCRVQEEASGESE